MFNNVKINKRSLSFEGNLEELDNLKILFNNQIELSICLTHKERQINYECATI